MAEPGEKDRNRRRPLPSCMLAPEAKRAEPSGYDDGGSETLEGRCPGSVPAGPRQAALAGGLWLV
jgi:hypothetical protein